MFKLILGKKAVPIYVPAPTRCLDFGPLSPASQARSPLTATTTTTVIRTPKPTRKPLSVALTSQLNLLNLFFGPCLAACLPFGTISVEPSPWNRDTLELQYKITHATVDREPPPSTTQRSDILVKKLSRWRPLRLPVTAALGASRQTRLRGVTPPLLGRQKPPIEVKDNRQDTRVAAALAFVFC